ncbi:MAG: GIY-YIG nuclease family protein [Ignavibacteriales bacterium]|nr:GIY-YIG nuclease family protein [Ignavibacteriales bacterium]
MDNRNSPAVYILANNHNTVIYIGMTHSLSVRIRQHKEKLVPGFTKRYNVDKLVYYEYHTDIRDAIGREKQLKAGSRKRKIELIESMNPDWKDLYSDIV